jgi:hypothetical protein
VQAPDFERGTHQFSSVLDELVGTSAPAFNDDTQTGGIIACAGSNCQYFSCSFEIFGPLPGINTTVF